MATARLDRQVCVILRIRAKQIFRIAVQIGVVRALIVAGALLFALAALFRITASGDNPQYSRYLAAAWIAALLLNRTRRRDNMFLQLYLTNRQIAYLAEYLLLSLPIIACLAINGRWESLAALIAGIAIVAIAPGIDLRRPARTPLKHLWLIKRIPPDMYEWRGGVRKNFIILAIVLPAGACLSFFTAAAPVAIAIFGFIAMDFYRYNESWQMLLPFRKSSSAFMLHKTVRHSMLWTACNIPLITLFAMFHREWWYIPIIETIMLAIIHCYLIALKYACYKPDSETTNSSPVLQTTGIIMGLIPLTSPLTALVSIYFYRKAAASLKQFLPHDNN
ncbi:MAG: hypothetical protein LBC81_01150 [Tannerellaceae bacterium]|jgi:hypothetical protein|nr:hypothetical protein [Tannerellaceae bacterium]